MDNHETTDSPPSQTSPATTTELDLLVSGGSSDVAKFTLAEAQSQLMTRACAYTKQVTDKFLDAESNSDGATNDKMHKTAVDALNDLAGTRRLFSNINLRSTIDDRQKFLAEEDQIIRFIKSIRLVDTDQRQQLFVHENICKTDDYQQRSVFIRSCYNDLIEIIFKKNKNYARIAINGNTGVGKTWFGAYVIACALNKYRMNVLYWSHPYKPMFFPVDGPLRKNVDVDEYLSSERDLLYLIDGNEPNIGTDCRCKAVLLCSSVDSYTKTDFHKGRNSVLFYMPMWSCEELEQCRSSVYRDLTSEEIEKRFMDYGGFARLVFEGDGTWVDTLVKLAIDNFHINLANALLGDLTGITDSSGLIITRKKTETAAEVSGEEKYGYSGYHPTFSSDSVASKVTNKVLADHRKALLDFLNITHGISDLSILRGKVFEAFAHDKLARGGKFKIRLLREGDAEVQDLLLSSRLVANPYKDILLTNAGDYNRPLSKIAATFDSFIFIDKMNFLFQITVSKKGHDINAKGLVSFQNFLMKKLRGNGNSEDECKILIFFVVPPDIFDSYTRKQKIVEDGKVVKQPDGVVLDQYVLELPLEN